MEDAIEIWRRSSAVALPKVEREFANLVDGKSAPACTSVTEADDE